MTEEQKELQANQSESWPQPRNEPTPACWRSQRLESVKGSRQWRLSSSSQLRLLKGFILGAPASCSYWSSDLRKSRAQAACASLEGTWYCTGWYRTAIVRPAIENGKPVSQLGFVGVWASEVSPSHVNSASLTSPKCWLKPCNWTQLIGSQSKLSPFAMCIEKRVCMG